MPIVGTNLDNYEISYNYGTLKVIKPSTKIVVTANSSTREYDGTELTNPGYTYTQGVLAEGDVLYADVEGSAFFAGDVVENVVKSVTILRGSEDVTDNYDLDEFVKGTLTVTKRKVVLESQSHD